MVTSQRKIDQIYYKLCDYIHIKTEEEHKIEAVRIYLNTGENIMEFTVKEAKEQLNK